MIKTIRHPFWLVLALCLFAMIPLQYAYSQQPADPEVLALKSVVMCEDIRNLKPLNKAVVFSQSIGSVSCFSVFDPVPIKTVIYHLWYHRDKLSSRKKLHIRPPRWSSVSSIQLRECDQGPWRVEVVDSTGKIHKTVRFSITD